MNQIDEHDGFDDTPEAEGRESQRQTFLDIWKRVNIAQIAEQLGGPDKTNGLLSEGYRAALWFYHINRALPKIHPPRQESIRALNRISKAAETLNRLLKEAYQEESYVWWFIDDTYMANETEAAFKNMPADYEGLSLGECEMEKMLEGTAFLASMTIDAEKSLPNKGKGKPKTNAAVEAFVRRLATILSEHTGEIALKGNYWNGITGQYEGKFIGFVENSVGLFPQQYPLTNNALGEIIRRALGAR